MKKVKFQLEPRKIVFIPSVEGEGVWHSQKSLLHMRDVAFDTALQSRYDPRYTFWNTLFQDPASENLLCLWTTNSNTLRGLEQFVCDTLRRQRMLEHTERVLAILQAQRRHCQIRRQQQRKQLLGVEKEMQKDILNSDKSETEAEELAAISSQYSQGSIEMAKVMGKSDAFAVSVDDQKCIRIAWIRDQMFSKWPNNHHTSVKSKNSLPSPYTGSSCSIMSQKTSTAA
jgi:hypothetical protein